jgi:replicative DNA helicase
VSAAFRSGLRSDSRVDQLRIPPQSVEAEQSVLGGLMLAPEALAKVNLADEDFYRRDHQLIFRAICELDRKGQPFDAVTLSEWFDAQGLSEQVAGGAYLIELASTTPSAANIEAYADIVRDKSRLRRVVGIASALVNDAYAPGSRSSSEIVDEAVGALMALVKQESRHEFTLRQAMRAAYEDMEAAYAAGGKLRGITTGFTRIDQRLGGFHAGDLIVIGARPAMGKTALLVNLAEAAAEAGHAVGFISGEQSAQQVAQRALSRASGVAAERMRSADLEEDEWSRLLVTMKRLLEHDVYLLDRSAPTIDEVRRTARKWKQEHGIKALYVDYAQRIRVPKADNRVEEVAEVARSLKEIARDLDVPVVALAQVIKAVDHREDKRPGMSDLANSDELVREADVIAMLYRDEVHNENSPDKGIAEFNVEKNRHGPCGQFRLAWIAETMRFGNLTIDEF